jgi:protein-S-isoprenylcysteine O-methyltransferase Ste14
LVESPALGHQFSIEVEIQQEFGAAWDAYAQRTRRLIPLVW